MLNLILSTKRASQRTTLFLMFILVSGLTLAQDARDRDESPGERSTRLAPPATVIPGSFGARGTNQATGVLITQVIPGSPAQAAGLEVRDIVITVGGYQVGQVNGRTYDMEQEVNRRADRNGQVTLLVKDWRTGNLSNIVANVRSSSSQRPPDTRPPGNSQINQIYAWYDKYLQRPPTSSELTSWIESLSSGGFASSDVQAYLLGSNEYFDRFGFGNDVSYISSLFEVTQGRKPTRAEHGQWLTELKRYGSSRVAFVKRFLDSQQGTVTPIAPGRPSTAQITQGLRDYQRLMAPFATWGYYGDQSALVFRSNAIIRELEQYGTMSLENSFEQQLLAAELSDNANKLVGLAGNVLDRAKRTNQMVNEARQMVDQGTRIKASCDQLLATYGRP